MYAAERSVVVTLKQANDMAEQLASPRGRSGRRCVPCVVGP